MKKKIISLVTIVMFGFLIMGCETVKNTKARQPVLAPDMTRKTVTVTSNATAEEYLFLFF